MDIPLSSRGIGRAIAESFADAGAKVIVSSRQQKACDEVTAVINAKHGDERAMAIAASISDKIALQNLVTQARKHFSPISLLVCNAATNPYYGPMAEISDEQFRKIFENNILANHWLISMIAPEMARSGAGSIIIISSIGGLIGTATIGAYNISKAADLQLVRNLAIELGSDGVRVNAIAPGVVRTNFAKAVYESPEAEAALKRATPLGRIGEPKDISGTAVFLASKASEHITGRRSS